MPTLVFLRESRLSGWSEPVERTYRSGALAGLLVFDR
jgi:hypothetical protein